MHWEHHFASIQRWTSRPQSLPKICALQKISRTRSFFHEISYALNGLAASHISRKKSYTNKNHRPISRTNHFSSPKLLSIAKLLPARFLLHIHLAWEHLLHSSSGKVAGIRLCSANILRKGSILDRSVKTSSHQPRTLHLKPAQLLRTLRLYKKWQ